MVTLRDPVIIRITQHDRIGPSAIGFTKNIPIKSSFEAFQMISRISNHIQIFFHEQELKEEVRTHG